MAAQPAFSLGFRQPSVFPAIQTYQATFRIIKKFRLHPDAAAILGLFVQSLRNTDGKIDLSEMRWESRGTWCRLLGADAADDKTKKQVSDGFAELKRKGLMEHVKDADRRWMRFLTKAAIKAFKECLEVAPKPRLVPPCPTPEIPEVTTPTSDKDADLAITAGQKSTTEIPELELNKELKNKIKTPLALIASLVEGKGSLKPKKRNGLTQTVLIGKLASCYSPFERKESIVALLRDLSKEGFEFEAIEKAADDQAERSNRTLKYHRAQLESWKELCKKAAKALESESGATGRPE